MKTRSNIWLPVIAALVTAIGSISTAMIAYLDLRAEVQELKTSVAVLEALIRESDGAP